MSRRRDAEAELAQMLSLAGGSLAKYETQYAYVPGRKFRADFAWPWAGLLVEIQGGVYTGKAHGSISGIKADIERLNLATLHGWKLLRFLPEETEPDRIADTLATIEAVLEEAS